jgi:hypothetical protein
MLRWGERGFWRMEKDGIVPSAGQVMNYWLFREYNLI